MLTLADLMTPDPLTLDPDQTLREAIEQLSAAGVSGAPVITGDRLVGVVSASDILDFQSANPGIPSYREDRQEWGEWGPADLAEKDMSDPPAAYFREMWADSSADLVARMAEPGGPEWDALSEHVVGEVMTRKILSLPPATDAAEAARLMVERGIHRLIIAEDLVLMGIVSAMDFVRAVGDERLRPST
jgi:CBS domain-containing protein